MGKCLRVVKLSSIWDTRREIKRQMLLVTPLLIPTTQHLSINRQPILHRHLIQFSSTQIRHMVNQHLSPSTRLTHLLHYHRPINSNNQYSTQLEGHTQPKLPPTHLLLLPMELRQVILTSSSQHTTTTLLHLTPILHHLRHRQG